MANPFDNDFINLKDNIKKEEKTLYTTSYGDYFETYEEAFESEANKRLKELLYATIKIKPLDSWNYDFNYESAAKEACVNAIVKDYWSIQQILDSYNTQIFVETKFKGDSEE